MRAATIIACVAVFAGCATDSELEVASQDTTPPPVRASQIFCGKVRLWNDDCSPNFVTEVGWSYSSSPVSICGTVNGVLQWSNWVPSCYADQYIDVRYPATQNFEVRGWIIGGGGDPNRTYDGEDEYHLDIKVDLGWQPDGWVTPLNTLSALMQYVPSTNLVQFGNRNLDRQHYGNSLWGGAGQAIIHVEVDGWGLGRGGGYGYLSRAPLGWIPYGQEIETVLVWYCEEWDHCGWVPFDRTWPIYWPTDLMPMGPDGTPTPFGPGQYVSIVGTQWRDGSHVECHWWPFGCAGDAQNQAKLCLRNHTGLNYWAEMHSPDVIRRLPEPLPANHHDVLAYTSCSDDWVTLDDVASLNPPYPYSHIASVTPYALGQNALPAPPNVGWNTVGIHIPSQGAMTAFYDVTWACTPSCAGRCGGGSDGCGGTCATTCASPFTCNAGSCGCPAGTSQCLDGSCQAVCPSVCGDGVCGGAETCNSCASDCGQCPDDGGGTSCPTGRYDCCGTGACLTALQCRKLGC